MRCIVGAFFFLFANLSMAATPDPNDDDECGYRRVFDGTVFALTIVRSFDPHVTFMLCQREQPDQSFVLVSVNGTGDLQAQSEERIPLDQSSYENLVKLYEDALNYDVKDSTMGLDGSSWCLETRRGFTYSKACFWTPSHDTETRGLIGLQKLGEALWTIAALNQTAGSLY